VCVRGGVGMTTVRDLSKIVDIQTSVRIINQTNYVYAEYGIGEMIDKQYRDLEVVSMYVADTNTLILVVRDEEENIDDAKPIEQYLI